MARPLIVLLPALTAAQDMHAAFMSQHGVQHKLPLISDDLIVGLIMIMFLMLFAFGMPSARVIDHIFWLAALSPHQYYPTTCFFARAACCAQASNEGRRRRPDVLSEES